MDQRQIFLFSNPTFAAGNPYKLLLATTTLSKINKCIKCYCSPMLNVNC